MGVVPRLITVCTVLLFALLVQVAHVPPASATAPADPFVWSRTGPSNVRFSGAATSKDGSIAFAVPDPAGPTNPPAKGYRSTNAGATWTEMSAMESRYWLSVDTSANGQVVFATGSVYVSGAFQSAAFKSVDSGVTWTTALAFDPATPGTVYGDVSVSDNGQKVVIGTNVGLVYSADQGSTWSSIWSGDATGVTISGNGSVIMVGERNTAIHKSTNAGGSWTTVNGTAQNWSNVELSTDGSSALAVATRGGSFGGAFFTHDGGATWTDAGLNSTFADNQFATGAMSPDGNTMIASSYYSHPRISFDGGATWSVLPSGATGWVQWTAFAIANPDPTLTANTVEPIIIGTSENYRIARFGQGLPPTVSYISPAQGRHTGGRTVQISGNDFVGVTSVAFGGIAAQSFTVVSPQLITAVTPAHSAGLVSVVVTTPRGSATVDYTYVDYPAPSITSVSPSAIASGTVSLVTVRGSNLENLLSADLGGEVLDLFLVDTNTLVLIMAPHAAGSVPVTLTFEGGVATTTVVYDDALNPPSRPSTVLTSFNPTSSNDMHVRSLAGSGAKGLVVAGEFRDANGIPAADCVARWDGVNWYALGSNEFGDGIVHCDESANEYVSRVEVASDGRVVIEGGFTLWGSFTRYRLAVWDGSSWTGIIESDAIQGGITSVDVSVANRIIIGGNFQLSVTGDAFDNFAVWNGRQWGTLGRIGGTSPFNDMVTDVKQGLSGLLYVSGSFTDVGGDPIADYLAVWDGTRWSAVGDDGSGGPKFTNDRRKAMAVEATPSGEVVYVAVSSDFPENRSLLFAYSNGKWTTVKDSFEYGLFGMLEARPGILYALGVLSDSTTASLNYITLIRNGSSSAYSIETAFVDSGSWSVLDVEIMPDGRLALVVIDETKTPQYRILIFDPMVTPTLPATGSKPPVLPAILVTSLGVLLRTLTRRRRFRVN